MADSRRKNEGGSRDVGREEPSSTRPGAAAARAGAATHTRLTEADQTMQQLVDRILTLPVRAQLGIVRTIAPRAVAKLDGIEQGAFMRDLFNDINAAIEGQAVYDVRPEPH